MHKTVVALYDSPTEAREARGELERAGFERSAITIADHADSSQHDPAQHDPSQQAPSQQDHGILSRLFGWGAPEEDAHVYADGVKRGGALLSLGLDEEDIDDALAVLERGKAVDIEERRAGHREAAGHGGATGLGNAAGAFQDLNAGRDEAARDEVIPLVEEHLNIGKRRVERGGVRVRSYTVETPVQEQVTLRDETVSVERRPIDQGLDRQGPDNRADNWGMVPGEAAFRERTVEVTETDEVPVVSKQARVKGEIVVRKDVEERAQTVSDTVRRTEFEIEDSRTNAPGNRAGDAKR